ncbi:MAG: septum formation initiator family protein [Patescibacteria group bacterium]
MARTIWIRQPSWWLVLISGVLFITFSVAIVRELLNGQQVRQQVRRLQDQVAGEQRRQQQLQDLIDYLGSPTFQEQEARLKLGLKKSGEQVIVVPSASSPTTGSAADAARLPTDATGRPLSHPQRWWQYFFGPDASSLRTNA